MTAATDSAPDAPALPTPGSSESSRRGRRERDGRPRAHPVARWSYIGVFALLVLSIPVLTYVGLMAVGRSNAGREPNVITDPSSPGFEAAVEPTPTMLVTQTDVAGAISGVTVLSLNTAGGGGSLTFFPAGTELELPFTETGMATLDVIYQGAGPTGLEQRVETLLGAGTEEVTEIRADADQWTSLLAPIGPLTIDNPVVLQTTDALGGPVTFAQGPVEVVPEQIGLFVNSRGAEDNDLTRVERQQAFWASWLAAVKAATDPGAVPGETDVGLGRFVRGLAKGDAAMNTLPVTTVGIPGVPATDTNLFLPDEVAVDNLVAQTIPFPVGVGRLRTRVLDGTDTGGLAVSAARVLVPAGAEISIIGNALSFDHDETIVRYYDRTEEDGAQRLLDALGGGRLVLQEDVTDTVDATVILGRNFDPDTAPGATATSTTVAGVAATDPFAVTTTVPFGAAPTFTPPTELPE